MERGADHAVEELTLARLPSGVELSVRVHRYRGGADGPTVYVQAAQHGRELNGTEALRRLHERLDPSDLAGELVVVPVANPLTFDYRSYMAPQRLDALNSNMNRVWPGDLDGTLHERMAARLWEVIEEAEVLVDLHTGSPDMLSHVVYRRGDARARELAEVFGLDLLLTEAAGDDADEEWEARDFGGKLRTAATEAGIVAITPELAHNRQIEEAAADAGVDGVRNVLCACGSLPGEPAASGEVTTARNHLGRVPADCSGLFRLRPDLELGARIAAGDRLGTVYDPTTFEALQPVEATHDGVLYSVTRESTVVAGENLASVALPEARP